VIVRVLSYLVWVVAIIALLLPLLRRTRLGRARRPAALGGELVKDPVCQTYVVRARAVQRMAGGEPRYFCSVECARRYAGRA
jgi:YHS domain-containing protein